MSDPLVHAFLRELSAHVNDQGSQKPGLGNIDMDANLWWTRVGESVAAAIRANNEQLRDAILWEVRHPDT